MLTTSIQLLRAMLRDRAGISSLEYGILAMGVIGALAVAMTAILPQLTALWADVAADIKNAVTAAGG